MFKPLAMTLPTAKQLRQPQAMDQGVDNIVHNVFKVLHGAYGTLFLTKFATGQLASEGQDKGVLSARQIWAQRLHKFDSSTVETALCQCMERNPEFPPSLPQLLALCAANSPREVYKPEVPAIGMGQALCRQYAAQAREINARHAKKAMQNRLRTSAPVSGLGGLMQAIANAVANAGGDEVAVLIRLDAMLAPKRALEAA